MNSTVKFHASENRLSQYHVFSNMATIRIIQKKDNAIEFISPERIIDIHESIAQFLIIDQLLL
jgi:hypothetical protein